MWCFGTSFDFVPSGSCCEKMSECHLIQFEENESYEKKILRWVLFSWNVEKTKIKENLADAHILRVVDRGSRATCSLDTEAEALTELPEDSWTHLFSCSRANFFSFFSFFWLVFSANNTKQNWNPENRWEFENFYSPRKSFPCGIFSHETSKLRSQFFFFFGVEIFFPKILKSLFLSTNVSSVCRQTRNHVTSHATDCSTSTHIVHNDDRREITTRVLTSSPNSAVRRHDSHTVLFFFWVWSSHPVVVLSSPEKFHVGHLCLHEQLSLPLRRKK